MSMLLETPGAGLAPAVREITYAAAIREALDEGMAVDERVYLIGEGVPDPKGIFGTTLGLREKYGRSRVLDMPLSENGMTGVIIGSCIAGMRPVLMHQRLDFALLSMDQIVNNAAKWHYMFGGQQSIPLVIRMVLGRGWGQGPQHSQSLQAWFAHIPGLKVVMPATASDAKGLLLASILDDNPVIFLEHRWLHNVTGRVPTNMEPIPLGRANVARPGRDLTIVSTSYMTLEALRAAEFLAEAGVEAEVVDVRTIRPLDTDTILESVRRTGRVIVADTGTTFCGVSAEITAFVSEQAFSSLRCAPRRLASPESPSPSTPTLAADYYPRALHLARTAVEMLELPGRSTLPYHTLEPSMPLDVPDKFFSGPF